MDGVMMSVIEKMQRYIELTNVPENGRYQICVAEVLDLQMLASELPVRAVCLAFNYGRAKGYRMAKAEVLLPKGARSCLPAGGG